MFGNTSVGVLSTDFVPNNTIKIARTTKVYGRRKAMRTIWFMPEVCQKRFAVLSYGHSFHKGSVLLAEQDADSSLLPALKPSMSSDFAS